LNACASALVTAFGSSAHSSPVAECKPKPKIISSQVTNTFATVFWSLVRSKLALACTAYFRVQPAGLNNELRRSVYAR
jgi:hypothetical protein